jgi:cytochrome c5
VSNTQPPSGRRDLARIAHTARTIVLLATLSLPFACAKGEVPAAGLRNGREVYAAVCASCHDAGLAGAPRTGDKAAWAGRLSQGMGLLYLHSLKGYTGKAGVMPPRGGRLDLPVELVKQSVDYMVSRSN